MYLLRGLEGLIKYCGSVGIFIKDTIYFLFTRPRNMKIVLKEIVSIGLDSFFLVSLISFFVGIIIAFQTASFLKTFSSEIYISSLVGLSLVRELGPVLGSLIVAARSGAAITAGIGAMKISEQVDALEAFAVNPVDYLVVPKFISLVFSMPLLVIYGGCLGIFGGYVVGAAKFSIPFNLYFQMTFESLQYKDIVSGLIKSVCFGSIIAFISAFEGFRPQSSSDVSTAVQMAVVRSFLLIIMSDCILTALFYFVLV